MRPDLTLWWIGSRQDDRERCSQLHHWLDERSKAIKGIEAGIELGIAVPNQDRVRNREMINSCPKGCHSWCHPSGHWCWHPSCPKEGQRFVLSSCQ